MTKWIPTQEQINKLVEALPAATMQQIADRTGYGIAQVKMIKTYLNHNPELGYQITSAKTGSPDFLKQQRHRLIIKDQDLAIEGLISILHNSAMYAECALNEIKARMEIGSSEEKALLEPLVKSLEFNVYMIREAKSKVA